MDGLHDRISVVIPCRNEKPYIKECIDAIFLCELPENSKLNVFVVDGMSDDGTREVVYELQKIYPTLVLVDNKKQLTPFAFNLGIYAGGKVDFVQIIGARHIVSSNYIKKGIEILQNNSSIWCVGGQLINEYTNTNSKIISKAMNTTFGMGIGNFRILTKSGFTDTVTSPMYPYRVFEKIGFFDEQLVRNQDDDFNFRVTENGGKIYFEHDISLRYYVRTTFNGLYKQFFQYGYWKVFVNRKHHAITTTRQMIPPLFVLFLLLFPFLLIVNTYIAISSSLFLFIYCLLAIYFAAKNGTGIAEKIGILKTFPILHIGYGLGYLKGIIHFIIMNKNPSKRETELTR
jgi:GT2 family glycosyltransferase